MLEYENYKAGNQGITCSEILAQKNKIEVRVVSTK